MNQNLEDKIFRLRFDRFRTFLNFPNPTSNDLIPFKELLVSPLIESLSTVDKVRFLYLRNIADLGYLVRLPIQEKELILIPDHHFRNKEFYKQLVSKWRADEILKRKQWINDIEPIASKLLASPIEVINSEFKISVEVCKTKEQKEIFKYFGFYSSMPYNRTIGRGIKFLIRDCSYPRKPIIGISGIGSPVVQMIDRDNWIGWEKNSQLKMDRLKNIMDLHTCISIPPYSYLLGGKLLCYIMASNEIRQIVKNKYENCENSDEGLAALFTTSYYGNNSSQYNRIKVNKELLYIPVGTTKGFGKSLVDKELYKQMKLLVGEKDNYKKYKMNGGTNRSFRILRKGIRLIGGVEDILLKHGIQKGIYMVPLATNTKNYLQGLDNKIQEKDYPLEMLIEFWKQRWLFMRKENPEIIRKIEGFKTESLLLNRIQ